MENNLLPERLQREWEDALATGRNPEAGTISQHPPGRYALFAMLEEPLGMLREMRESGLLSRFSGRFINTSWSVRDLIVHLASWAKELRTEVETLAAQGRFDYAIPFGLSVLGPAEWNRNELDSRRESGMEKACLEYEEEILRVQDLILELSPAILYQSADTPYAPGGDPAARWRGSIAMVIVAQTRHFAYHLGQLQGRLKQY